MPGTTYQSNNMTFDFKNSGTTVVLEGGVIISMASSQKITVGNGARFSIIGSIRQVENIKAGPGNYIETANNAPLFDITGGTDNIKMSLKNLTIESKYTGSTVDNAMFALNSTNGTDDHFISIDSCYLESPSSDVAIIDTVNQGAQTTIQIRNSFLHHNDSAINAIDTPTAGEPNKLRDIKLVNNIFYSTQGDVSGSHAHINVRANGVNALTNITLNGNTFWSNNGSGGVYMVRNLSNTYGQCFVSSSTSNIANKNGLAPYYVTYYNTNIPLLQNQNIHEPDKFNF